MKFIGAVIIVILTSLFYFPFNSAFLPSVNTKMAMAVLGLALFALKGFQDRNGEIDRTLLSVSVWAFAVSFVGLISVTLNGTPDYTYATYIISLWVWLAGAYVVIRTIELFYGKATLRLVSNFLIAVCVCQCIMSQLTDNYAAVASWVKSFVVSDGFMGIPEGRLYGIGCALDVAGLKFCVVLLLIAYYVVTPSGKINRYLEVGLYLLSFAIIGVCGSMIARTTTIGIGMAVLFWIVYPIVYKDKSKKIDYLSFLQVLVIFLVVLLPAGIYLYRTDPGFKDNLRFGFEGFFSLVEKGEWDVRSNDMMMIMWIWPDNLKTWIIGDGYFDSPMRNPYYIGSNPGDFYMGTDIGYCRFVFYFGIVGLLTFCGFFINCIVRCCRNIPGHAVLFWSILIINFIGWCKVSSDIFPVIALFLLISSSGQDEKEIREIKPYGLR